MGGLRPGPDRRARHARGHDADDGLPRAGRRGRLAGRRTSALGHRRLAVIDIEGGRQPMAVERGRPDACSSLTYSGEIYNFRELRAELAARGHRFRTRSDTEVVLRAYLEWGDELRRAAQRHVRLRDLGHPPRGAAAGPRPDGHQAAVLLPDRRRRAVRLRAQGDPGPPAGASRWSTPTGCASCSPSSRRPGTRSTGACARCGPATSSGCAARALHGHALLGARGPRAHRRPATPPSRTVRELLDDIVDPPARSPTCRCARCSPAAWTPRRSPRWPRADCAAAGSGPVRSFSVDFVGYTENFAADADARHARRPVRRTTLAEHVGADHTDIVLDTADLMDPAAPRRRAARARPAAPARRHGHLALPAVQGDPRRTRRWRCPASRPTRCSAATAGSTTPDAVAADTFPWLAARPAASAARPARERCSTADLLDKLDLAGYVADGRTARRWPRCPRLPTGEAGHERRMREICYLHLTRFVQILLDRKDRMSMAVGLEVRVPFCDHRLVEYVFNTPWAMKTFDGREKSLLRAATADLLPESVAQRVKSPYPSTQDPRYTDELRHRAEAAARRRGLSGAPARERGCGQGCGRRPGRGRPFERGARPRSRRVAARVRRRAGSLSE